MQGELLPIEAYDREFKEQFGHGSLLAVDNRLDTATGTLTCKARLLPDASNLMIPGLFLNIRMLLEVKHGLILVPTAAVQHGPEGTYVWVIRPDQTAGLRRVAIGAQEEQTAGIQDGLSPGELVVTDGAYRVNEGRKVTYKLASGAEQGATTLTATPAALAELPTQWASSSAGIATGRVSPAALAEPPTQWALAVAKYYDWTATHAALAEPPTLRFLAWQDEWQTNQPGAARHPDGSPVTDPIELNWLRQVQPTREVVTGMNLKSEPRFLHLWLSHPALEGIEFDETSLLDGTGKPIQLGANGLFALQPHDPDDRNGNLSWFTATLSPGEGNKPPVPRDGAAMLHRRITGTGSGASRHAKPCRWDVPRRRQHA